MRRAGIDGCKAGWVAVVAEGDGRDTPRLAVSPTLAGLFAAEGLDFAVLDMPVGLVAGPGPREVEPALRRRLKGKASSVFSTPCRAALAETSYAGASAANARAPGRRLSRQSFAIFPKMREADAAARQLGQVRLREGHPEVSFALMAGAPVPSRRRRPEGLRDRLALPERAGLPVTALLGARPARVGADDILDAAALLWTALRFGRGQHETFPPVPVRDAVGLEMSAIA